MRFLGYFLQFTGIVTVLYLTGNLLPQSIFQYYTWIAHSFLCINITMWILVLIQDYFFTAKVNPKNKAILITGCDTGFGNAMARILDRRGYQVFACCLDKSSDGASELKEVCSRNLSVIQMDVTDDGSVSRAVNLVKEQLGNSVLWAVVNNAGVLKGFLTEFSTMNDYEMCLQVNTLGMVRVSKAFLPMLRESKGRVVNICSLAGRFRSLFMGAYMISKSASVAFTEVLCQEMREFGVRVISVDPEFFKTPMCSEEYLTNFIMKNSLSDVKEDVMSAYGKDYIEKAKKLYRSIFYKSSPDVNRVYDAIEAAVSLQNPSDVYRPTRNFYVTNVLMLADRMPLVFIEIFLKAAYLVMGLPTPKKGVTFFSKLLNI